MIILPGECLRGGLVSYVSDIVAVNANNSVIISYVGL